MDQVFETVDEDMNHAERDRLLLQIDSAYARWLLKVLRIADGMDITPATTVITIPLLGAFRTPSEVEIQCVEGAQRPHAAVLAQTTGSRPAD